MYANAYSISLHNNDNKMRKIQCYAMYSRSMQSWENEREREIDCERTMKRCYKSQFHIKYDYNFEYRLFCSHSVRRRSISTECVPTTVQWNSHRVIHIFTSFNECMRSDEDAQKLLWNDGWRLTHTSAACKPKQNMFDNNNIGPEPKRKCND